MYESAAQQEELKQKVDDFLRRYHHSRTTKEENGDSIPIYLFLALGPSYGLCPYLHPRFDSQVRIQWLDLLHKYKGTPPSSVVIDDLRRKYVIQTEIQDLNSLCLELRTELLEELDRICDKTKSCWKSVEARISAWLMSGSSSSNVKKKDAAIMLNDIIGACTKADVNFFNIYQVVKGIKITNYARSVSKKLDEINDQQKLQTLVTQLDKTQSERKEITKRIEKEIFQCKKKLFELSESKYVCARLGKVNSTYARLDYGN